ncbi:MAG: bifunctional diaminohydroxyphosphoribosylaminopyrimidine deaminase/5-amino-6-(5-phosphoribosylamino)uracil reductase RibD [Planctomycetaceae bacterium]|nr:bifunctional diaminohydroxyphosphoribosylaminopyrimidine deaminase/5-amino-6-(5-phosphoribosylamino)uracil reductase RibD [Planctomycetaceae bacterium]
MTGDTTDAAHMRQALSLARQGAGRVEPNPQVGAIVVDRFGNVTGEGFHQRFGGPHAEINAIAAAGDRCRESTLYVTLEPCSHFGKTPPCADAVIEAGVRRVVIGCTDPAPHVAGAGIEKLRRAGVEVVVGVCQDDARRLIAPFAMLQLRQRPWVTGKWAMSLDGRIATRTGSSQWISGTESRSRVHELRGQVDAIITGSGTVIADDPALTARPAGPRTAARIVLDASGTSLRSDRQLVGTAHEIPVIAFVGENQVSLGEIQRLTDEGVEVLALPLNENGHLSASDVLSDLGRRRFTNVLLEGGPGLIGKFSDEQLIDEVHVFLAPKLIGGIDAPGPVGGLGIEWIRQAGIVNRMTAERIGDDLLIRGDLTCVDELFAA